MARTFEPEDRIAHYRIVGPLGAGGMGEVYLARDETLDRSVALKILPPALVRSDERLRRFVAEAKAASSLNHPNIVTIYEIGSDRVRAASDPIHYISMELVAGETLETAIHQQHADLRTLVGWLAQAAEGVAKAHASGIVHRDLKPGNVMISKDGFVKVLDFGLAKLTERREISDAERTSAPTEAVTGAGVVMGTIGYMSPEQVLGKPVDHRADIFSLGCMLYEAATRKRPFAADSDIEVMHRILKEKPAPVEDINPDVPGELRRVIRRCLAKTPDQRFQSMKDVAIDLREMVESWDTLTSSTPSGGAPAIVSQSAVSRPARSWTILTAAAIVLGLGGLAFGVYALTHHEAQEGPGARAGDLKLSVLMSRSDLSPINGGSVLSADGRYLAYVTVRERTSSLVVRQVRTGSDIVVLQDNPILIRNIAFSRDGDFLYFTNQDPGDQNYSSLFRVPSIGGTPRKVLFDIDSAPAISADGKRACFRRGFPQTGEDTLQIADFDSGAAKDLIRIKRPERFVTDPDWSPDGKTILVGIEDHRGGFRARVHAVDIATGADTPVPGRDWVAISSVRFIPSGRAVLATALEASGGAFQIYRIALPDGAAQRLTNDFDGYAGLSVAADGSSVAAERDVRVGNLWVVRRKGSSWDAQPITSASGSSTSIHQIAPLPSDRIAFSAPDGDFIRVFSMNADGSRKRLLNPQGKFIIGGGYAERFGFVFNQVDGEERMVAHLWRVDADGSGLRQLTNGTGEELLATSPRGDALLFRNLEEPEVLYCLKPDGGPPRKITDQNQWGSPAVSPDGTKVLYAALKQTGDRASTFFHVVPIDGGDEVATFPMPPDSRWHQWSPDGKGMTYLDYGRTFDLMRVPMSPAGKPEVVAHAAEGSIEAFRYSADGAWLAYGVQSGTTDRLFIARAGESKAALVSEFKTGQIALLAWAPDAPVAYFIYRVSNRDVVLVSGLR